MIHQVVLGVQQCVVYLCANREQSQSSVFYQNALISMILLLIKPKLEWGRPKGPARGSSFTLGHAGCWHLQGEKCVIFLGPCLIITWKWYGYNFILKWPLLKDKGTGQEENSVCGSPSKNSQWQIQRVVCILQQVMLFKSLPLESSFGKGGLILQRSYNTLCNLFLSLWNQQSLRL